MKLRLFLVAVCVVSGASPAIAQETETTPLIDWPSTMVAVAGQTTNTISVARTLNGDSGCRVAWNDLLYEPYPSKGKLVAYKATGLGITIGAAMGLNALSNRDGTAPRSRKILRGFARALGYSSGGLGFAATGLNIKRCGW